MTEHQGGCHCGRVRFEVPASAIINVSQCNCSICSKSGLPGMTVPRDRFTLKSGEENLTEHTFDSGVAKHLFCNTCGIKSFYIPRSHPDGCMRQCEVSRSRNGRRYECHGVRRTKLGAVLSDGSSRRVFEFIP
jgi:hypothetical protein